MLTLGILQEAIVKGVTAKEHFVNCLQTMRGLIRGQFIESQAATPALTSPKEIYSDQERAAMFRRQSSKRPDCVNLRRFLCLQAYHYELASIRSITRTRLLTVCNEPTIVERRTHLGGRSTFDFRPLLGDGGRIALSWKPPELRSNMRATPLV